MERYLSFSSSETLELGYRFGRTLAPNSIICFYGDLASGKTTFIKGLVSGAVGIDPDRIQSPTFTYLHIYKGEGITVYHFDLYRLTDVDEFISMGFDDYFEAGGICCIEWSERISSYLPPGCIHVTLSRVESDKKGPDKKGPDKRCIVIQD